MNTTLKIVLAATVLASLPITAQADPATVWEVHELDAPTIACLALIHLREVEGLQAYGNVVIKQFMKNKTVVIGGEEMPSCEWLKKGYLFRRGIAKKWTPPNEKTPSYFCMELLNFGIDGAKANCLWINAKGDSDGLGRSCVLMHLGVLEGDTLATGVPRMQLEASEQPALGALAASDLVRLRDERVRFSHDLLGDWARMRVLVGEQSFASPASRDRANLPRWHRAVRLYGQRLLEQSAGGPERWQQAIAGLGDDTPKGSVIRDLFLESLFLATNAAVLLERSWAALCTNGGRLLNRMLNRFLFVATLPDPRVAALIQGETDGAQFEHLFRVPYWPYWGPLFVVLHAHRADVVRLAPHNAAKICSLWLKTTPAELRPGQPMPWRQEAAELAIAIGREIQALNAEGNYFSDGQDKSAYEAVLWAAPELPDEVAALCLELAERRDLNADIRRRIDQTQERRREERRQWLATHPERQRAPPPPSWPLGRLREPWLDGPHAGRPLANRAAAISSGRQPPPPNRTHAPSSLQNIRLSSDAVNSLTRSQN
jgi:hypothetical protein